MKYLKKYFNWKEVNEELTGNDFQFVFNAKDFFEEKDLSDWIFNR